MLSQKECIFCQIVKGEIPVNFVYQSDDVIVFPDINPKAKVHLLILPKEHISNLMSIKDTHSQTITQMLAVAQDLIKGRRLTKDGYRLVINGGRFQHVPHLHWHLLGGNLNGMV